MSALGIIAIVVGTLVGAWAFDRFFSWIFRDNKPPKDSIEYLRKLIKKI